MTVINLLTCIITLFESCVFNGYELVLAAIKYLEGRESV